VRQAGAGRHQAGCPREHSRFHSNKTDQEVKRSGGGITTLLKRIAANLKSCQHREKEKESKERYKKTGCGKAHLSSVENIPGEELNNLSTQSLYRYGDYEGRKRNTKRKVVFQERGK